MPAPAPAAHAGHATWAEAGRFPASRMSGVETCNGGVGYGLNTPASAALCGRVSYLFEVERLDEAVAGLGDGEEDALHE
jgi:hypothetical protein